MLARHDFMPDFVLPNAAGVATRLYGVAGGTMTMLAFLPAESNLHSELVALADELAVSVIVVHRQAPATPNDRVTAFVDGDGRVHKHVGADSTTATVFLLSKNLRVIATIPDAEASAIRQGLQSAAEAEAQQEPGHAPVLLIPNALDADFCDRLVDVLEASGGQATGVEVSRAGQRSNEIDRELKRRRDHTVTETALFNEITQRVAARVKPAVRKAFSFDVTRFEGFKIGCYDSEPPGFFRPHRDNLSPATAHRRFALSINLNDDYTGGELRFPEYGQAGMRPAKGGALVFSGSLLHEALAVTKGRRFVLLSFMYRAEDGRRTVAGSK